MFNDNLLRFIFCYYKINHKYKYLELYDYLRTTNLINKKWKYFSMTLNNFSTIPNHLYKLNLISTTVSKIENLNYSLRTLILMDTEVSKIENLTNSLHTLNLKYVDIY